MSKEQKTEKLYQLYVASQQVTQGIGGMKADDHEAVRELVCALKEMLHAAETLT